MEDEFNLRNRRNLRIKKSGNTEDEYMKFQNLTTGRGTLAAVQCLGLVILTAWLGGCCATLGVFDRVEHSLKTLQSYYDPLLKADGQNDRVRQAMVAVDTTLLLAGELQKQWCPDPKALEQLDLQVKDAGRQAEAAGVKPGNQ